MVRRVQIRMEVILENDKTIYVWLKSTNVCVVAKVIGDLCMKVNWLAKVVDYDDGLSFIFRGRRARQGQ